MSGAGDHLVEVDGVTHRIERDETGMVRSPAPAVVVAIHVAVGDDVEAGAAIAVLESMKMETVVRAPRPGRVREILAAVNSQVDAGAPLLRLDRPVDQAETTASDSATVSFSAQMTGDTANTPTRAHDDLDVLRAMITGYDVQLEAGA